jgi:hypothetical protein
MTSFLTESNSIHVIFWCVHSTATLTSTSKPSSTPSHWWFWANLNIHFPSMIENNDSVCIIQGKALCCHCCYLKIAWKQQWLSVWHKFSAVPHTFLIVASTHHPTQFSRSCWYCTKGGTMIQQISREQWEGSWGIMVPCFHHATSVVLHMGW